MADDKKRLPVETLYEGRQNFTIVGLTGMSGSGCSQLAKYMETPGFMEYVREPKDIHIKGPVETSNEKSFHENKQDEANAALNSMVFKQKYSICYNFAQSNYKSFTIIKYTKVIWLYTLLYFKGKIENGGSLKDCIENKDGYKVFYYKHQPVSKESDLQILFRFVWYGTCYDVNREVNNGRGPVDYKISHGAFDQCLVEFKLASNPHLEQNLKHQLSVYQKANQNGGNFTPGYTVILYFSMKDKDRAMKKKKKTELMNNPRIILIDASLETKESASLVQ